VTDATDAFADLYRSHFRSVVKAVRPLIGDAAEDVAQEAFTVLHARWAEVGTYEMPQAWVRRVALRIAARRAQRERMRVSLEPFADPPSSPGGIDLDLVRALDALPGSQAAIVALHHLADRSISEIADSFGLSESAVKVRLHRARARLAEQVGGYRGRWVSDRWETDAIVRHLRDGGNARHADVLLDDLGGRGRRWELVLVDGRYLLETDEGLLLDHGTFSLCGRDVILAPGPAPGRVVLRSDFDGNRMAFRMLSDSTPPTRSVPDDVWMGLFLVSSPFAWAGTSATGA
jgi:RNA polymerase sigma-70 factor (ECF subfamily)